MTGNDRTILRDLARRVADIAALPVQEQRRARWRRHNRLAASAGPMILIFPEGSWVELLPDAALTCEDEASRRIEWELRRRIYCHEHFVDDTVIEREWVIPKVIQNTGWGLAGKRIPAPSERGAWKFAPILKEAADLAQLHYPEISYDEPATQRNLVAAKDLFGDILDVKLKGVAHISYHLMSQYSDWRGLEETMLDMHLQPGLLHEAMARLEAGHHGVLRQLVAQNLLSLNNDGTYHSSGGVGYTDELPAAGFDPARVRPCDMWASAESQELAQVGPKQHAEFALAYEKRLLEPFGLTGYGCCEDLSRKLDDVLTIPHIRRISISPFADVDRSAEKLGSRAIFSWKPHPAHLVGDFDADAIRRYIRHTVAVARQHGCVLEMILKDTHTCEHHPERFDLWTQIAREEVRNPNH